MVMFTRVNILLALVATCSSVALVSAIEELQNVQAFQEDEGYWARFVQEVNSMPPSPAPTAECFVDVSTKS